MTMYPRSGHLSMHARWAFLSRFLGFRPVSVDIEGPEIKLWLH